MDDQPAYPLYELVEFWLSSELLTRVMKEIKRKVNKEINKWNEYAPFIPFEAIIIGRQKGRRIPITPTPEFKSANVIWAFEPLAIVATTVATIAPEPIPAIILEKIKKPNEGENIVKIFPRITKIEATRKIFFLSRLFTILDKIIDAIEILTVSNVAIAPIWPFVASINLSEIAIIFSGIIRGAENAHKRRPIKPIWFFGVISFWVCNNSDIHNRKLLSKVFHRNNY